MVQKIDLQRISHIQTNYNLYRYIDNNLGIIPWKFPMKAKAETITSLSHPDCQPREFSWGQGRVYSFWNNTSTWFWSLRLTDGLLNFTHFILCKLQRSLYKVKIHCSFQSVFSSRQCLFRHKCVLITRYCHVQQLMDGSFSPLRVLRICLGARA